MLRPMFGRQFSASHAKARAGVPERFGFETIGADAVGVLGRHIEGNLEIVLLAALCDCLAGSGVMDPEPAYSKLS